MTIKKEIGGRELICPNGSIVKAFLKWSNNAYAAEAGRAYYLVIDGKTHFPTKDEGVNSDELARIWAGNFVRAQGYKLGRVLNKR